MSVPAPFFSAPAGLDELSAEALFFAAGFEAVAGWPLPDGRLPIGARGQGGACWVMTRAAWNDYRALCEAERCRCVAPAVLAA